MICLFVFQHNQYLDIAAWNSNTSFKSAWLRIRSDLLELQLQVEFAQYSLSVLVPKLLCFTLVKNDSGVKRNVKTPSSKTNNDRSLCFISVLICWGCGMFLSHMFEKRKHLWQVRPLATRWPLRLRLPTTRPRHRLSRRSLLKRQPLSWERSFLNQTHTVETVAMLGKRF